MNWFEKTQTYFKRPVAEKAAKSLSNGIEIELRIDHEPSDLVYTFTREMGANAVLDRPSKDPHVVFTMTQGAAESILDDPADDIGQIGVHIAKMIFSNDPSKKVHLKLNTGFLTLFSKGYFGVVTAGGGAFASFLASKGLNGMGAIKDALKKMKG